MTEEQELEWGVGAGTKTIVPMWVTSLAQSLDEQRCQ
jgi:hypothetical protein